MAMFEDDRGKLEQIGEWLNRLRDDLASPNKLVMEVTWWRLAMVEQCCSRLTPSYLAQHPEIGALSLPTLDRVLNEPPPPASLSTTLARQTIEAFTSLLAELPPSPSPRPREPNPASRLDEVLGKLQEMEPYLRVQGISALYLFGSIARREDGPGSDVDLAFVVAADKTETFSLFDQSRISRELSEALGSNVDFVELNALHKGIRERANKDHVRIFGETTLNLSG